MPENYISKNKNTAKSIYRSIDEMLDYLTSNEGNPFDVEDELPTLEKKENVPNTLSVDPKECWITIDTDDGKTSYIIPDITDVQVKSGDKSHFATIVTFADGTREKAVQSEIDPFTIEAGISVCITKKLLRIAMEEQNVYTSETSAYNKLVKYAMKVHEMREEEQDEKKRRIESDKQKMEKRRMKDTQRRERRDTEARERQISSQMEAYIRAIREIERENRGE